MKKYILIGLGLGVLLDFIIIVATVPLLDGLSLFGIFGLLGYALNSGSVVVVSMSVLPISFLFIGWIVGKVKSK